MNLDEIALKVAKEKLETTENWEDVPKVFKDYICQVVQQVVAELAKQEPVAEYDDLDVELYWRTDFIVPKGKTKLYAAPGIPAGWVMVPEEPTEEMKDACYKALLNDPGPSHKVIYKAMLAAAPKGEVK